MTLREKTNNLQLTDKQSRGFIYLAQRTNSQRNNFFKSVISFETRRLEKIIESCESNPDDFRSKRELSNAREQLNNIGINTFKWLKDADRYFDDNLLTMVSKLDKFGFLEDNIMMDSHSTEVSEGLDLEFYIRGYNTETQQSAGRVYARLIWVECYEKVSHYRFICTLKK
jgi:hypothetical protein